MGKNKVERRNPTAKKIDQTKKTSDQSRPLEKRTGHRECLAGKKTAQKGHRVCLRERKKKKNSLRSPSRGRAEGGRQS